METIKKILEFLFTIGVIVFMLLGFAVVVIQLLAIITMNGSLATGLALKFSKSAIITASITGLIAFIQSYTHKWKISD